MRELDDLMHQARDWALRFPWSLDDLTMVGLSDHEVLEGIEENYDGGLLQFARDGQTARGVRLGPEVEAAVRLSHDQWAETLDDQRDEALSSPADLMQGLQQAMETVLEQGPTSGHEAQIVDLDNLLDDQRPPADGPGRHLHLVDTDRPAGESASPWGPPTPEIVAAAERATAELHARGRDALDDHTGYTADDEQADDDAEARD